MHGTPLGQEAITETLQQVPSNLFRNEIEKASQRFGQTPQQVATWFLQFAEKNLDELSSGQWIDLQYEMCCLSEVQYLPAALWQHALTETDWLGYLRYTEEDLNQFYDSVFHRSERGSVSLARLIPLAVPPTLPPRAAISILRDETLAVLKKISIPRHSVRFEPILEVAIASNPETDETISIGVALSPWHLFRYNLMSIVATTGVRLRQCRLCRHWFYADRKNKYYCKPSCQNCAGTRRFRHGDAQDEGREIRALARADDKSADHPAAKTRGDQGGKGLRGAAKREAEPGGKPRTR
jgi:hypothetical protein